MIKLTLTLLICDEGISTIESLFDTTLSFGLCKENRMRNTSEITKAIVSGFENALIEKSTSSLTGFVFSSIIL